MVKLSHHLCGFSGDLFALFVCFRNLQIQKEHSAKGPLIQERISAEWPLQSTGAVLERPGRCSLPFSRITFGWARAGPMPPLRPKHLLNSTVYPK